MNMFITLYNNILPIIATLPFVGCLLVVTLPTHQEILIKKVSLFVTCLTFILSLTLWLFLDSSYPRFQFVSDFSWDIIYNIKFSLGIDGISIFFLLLTTFIIPLCLLSSWSNIKENWKFYSILFLFLESCLILVFCAKNVFFFYVFFESVLIPMFLIVGIWGSRKRKIRASFMLFLYTLVGSVIMLLAISYIYSKTGSLEYEDLLLFKFSALEENFIWLAFFFAFASKVPMLPVHIWLPEAHVEAPTAGSVVLAGLLLKLASYGFIRYSLGLFPEASYYFSPFIFTLSILGIIYTSLTAIRQTDLKRVIAYTSVAHMNLVIIGIFSFSSTGVEGAILQSVSHGFVSSALFLIIGVLYDRHHSRMVKYYSGLVHTMPLFTTIFLIFTMANIALPGTSSFIGEFLILSGSFNVSIIVTAFGATGMVFGGAYALWLYNRVSYGNIKVQYLSSFQDLEYREFLVFLPLTIATVFLGVYPDAMLETIHPSVNSLVVNSYIR